MRRTHRMFWVSSLLSLLLAVTSLRAQSEAEASAPAADSMTPASDSAPEEGKKKGGLFGKAKKFVGDKTVQQVAKTVACNMVPGGQVVAGAIDAAASKSAGEAAAGAAGAATGQTCMPGGIAGQALGAGAGVPGAAGVAGAAGAAGVGGELGSALGAAGMAGGMIGQMGAPGADEMPEGSMDFYGSMAGGPAPGEIATCLGMTEEEYLDFTNPTRGQARPMTKDEMKRQGKAAKKVDMRRYQACMMQRYTGEVAR
jgi:hypothetical protein